MLVGVEVLHPVATEAGVGLQFPFIEAVADHLRVGAVLGQMAHPAAHQVEHHGVPGDPFAVELGEPCPEGGIEVLHKPGFRIKERVVGAIDFLAVRRAQHVHHHGQPIGAFILVTVPIERGGADHASISHRSIRQVLRVPQQRFRLALLFCLFQRTAQDSPFIRNR